MRLYFSARYKRHPKTRTHMHLMYILAGIHHTQDHKLCSEFLLAQTKHMLCRFRLWSVQLSIQVNVPNLTCWPNGPCFEELFACCAFANLKKPPMTLPLSSCSTLSSAIELPSPRGRLGWAPCSHLHIRQPLAYYMSWIWISVKPAVGKVTTLHSTMCLLPCNSSFKSIAWQPTVLESRRL